MKPNFAVFDFDGVICDSLQECLFSSFNAYQVLKGRERMVDVEKITTPTRESFHAMRPFVRSGEDYLLIHELIDQGNIVQTQVDFDFFRSRKTVKLSNFKEALYAERNRLIEKDFKKWISLNPLFPSMYEILRATDLGKVHILSTKRKEDILEILHHHEILIPEDHVSYSTAEEKIEKLLEILSEKDLKPEESIFLEDQIEYVIAAQQKGVRAYWAAWGYSSEEQQQRAIQANVPRLKLDQLKEIL